MRIIRHSESYISDIDILVRVYENQQAKRPEKEQICCEILFKPTLGIPHVRGTSWLPRGAVHLAVDTLNKLGDNKYKVQISNELPDSVGVLTSCRANFDDSLEWDNLTADLI